MTAEVRTTAEEKEQEKKATLNNLPRKPVEIRPLPGTTSYRELAKMDDREKPKKEKD